MVTDRPIRAAAVGFARTVTTDLNRLSLDALAGVLLPTPLLHREAARFMAEDEGSGDITSALTIDAKARGSARIVAREPCVLAGIDAAAFVATVGRRDLAVMERRRDGSRLERGAVVAVLEGRLRDLLTVERSVLNLLGRLCGIATLTAEFVAKARAARGSRTVVCDTRKTTPGLRAFEKYAVRCGGGTLHRIGLWDAVLVKDNHLEALSTEPGGALEALRSRLEGLRPVTSQRRDAQAARAMHAGCVGQPARGGRVARRGRRESGGRSARASRGSPSFIEVEVDRLEQFEQILRWPRGLVDIVLLDNMTPALIARAVRLRDRVRSTILLEASGGVRLETIASIARTGVDRISAGALTHSARSIDFSMEMDPPRIPSARAKGRTTSGTTSSAPAHNAAHGRRSRSGRTR